jgi:hypothetical protein
MIDKGYKPVSLTLIIVAAFGIGVLLMGWDLFGRGRGKKGKSGTSSGKNSAPDRDKPLSPFAGKFRGTFTFRPFIVQGVGPNFTGGNTTWSIDAKGGLFNNDGRCPGQGSVSVDGEVQYRSVDSAIGAYVVKGTIWKAGDGHLHGRLTKYSDRDRVVGVITIDLSRER